MLETHAVFEIAPIYISFLGAPAIPGVPQVPAVSYIRARFENSFV